MRKPSIPERWAEMAKEARAIAARTSDPSAKSTMLEIAANYDVLSKKSKELALRHASKKRTDM